MTFYGNSALILVSKNAFSVFWNILEKELLKTRSDNMVYWPCRFSYLLGCFITSKNPKRFVILSSNKSSVRNHHSRSKQRTDQRVLVLILKFLALKKRFSPRKKILPKFFLTFVYLYSMQLFSADPKIFSKKI